MTLRHKFVQGATSQETLEPLQDLNRIRLKNKTFCFLLRIMSGIGGMQTPPLAGLLGRGVYHGV